MPVIAFATKIDGDPNNITVDWSLYNQVIPLLDIQKTSIVFLLKALQSTHFLLLGFFNRERYSTGIFIIIIQFSGRNYINRFRTVTTPSKAKNNKTSFLSDGSTDWNSYTPRTFQCLLYRDKNLSYFAIYILQL